jgi:threonine aldolase
MTNIVYLRSDTLTAPTPEMRAAMAQAEVGDDVYGEDPTVNRLQELAAEMLGKEAGLFVPSGTMGNLVGVLAHCGRGDEVILGKEAHTYLFEAGGISVLGGVHSCQIPNQSDGSLALVDIEGAIRPHDLHQPPTRLIALENTHNRRGGAVLGLAYMQAVRELANRHGLAVHLDGARLFNAAVAIGLPARELVEPVDSVSICLSKGLCAPVGSVLCGSDEFIQKALRLRKILGGGMRQAGVLAAAGIISLESMVERLTDDHVRARRLAEGLAAIPGVKLYMGMPQTNMVFIQIDEKISVTARDLAGRIAERGVKVGVVGPRAFRMVTHYWIDDEGVDRTVTAFGEVLAPANLQS